MVVIPPPSPRRLRRQLLLHPPPQRQQKSPQQPQCPLDCLRYLGQVVLPGSQAFLDHYLEQPPSTTTTMDVESVRMIQANRYELFVQAVGRSKSTDCLDQLLQQHGLDPTQTKQLVISYAQSQARRDQRLFPKTIRRRAMFETQDFDLDLLEEDDDDDGDDDDDTSDYDSDEDPYKFGNFSLIITFGKVEAQAPHIDLLYPNYQFGLLVSDNSPATSWWYTPKHHPVIETVDDVLQAWERTNERDTHYYPADEHRLTIPSSLRAALHHSVDAQTLIRGFGTVLLPNEEWHNDDKNNNQKEEEEEGLQQGLQQCGSLTASTSTCTWPAGTLMSLPGSVVHAGPLCNDFRAVLFFSAWPKLLTPTTTTPPPQVTDQTRQFTTSTALAQHSQTAAAVPVSPSCNDSWSTTTTDDSDDDKGDDINKDDDDQDIGTHKGNHINTESAASATSTTTSVAEYHPDTQYSSVLLCGRLVQLLWRQVGMDYAARRYLLYQLYRYIRQGGDFVTPKARRIPRHWARHYNDTGDAFTAFVARMEQDDDNMTRQQDWQVIKETARNEWLCFYNVLGSRNSDDETDGDGGMLLGDFLQVSVPHLYISWQDDDKNGNDANDAQSSSHYYHVQIFERPLDGKVLVFYPNDSTSTHDDDEDKIGFSWEGSEPDKHYRLIRHRKQQQQDDDPATLEDSNSNNNGEYWFDGTNATLLDSDGEPIPCLVRLPSSAPSPCASEKDKNHDKNNTPLSLPTSVPQHSSGFGRNPERVSATTSSTRPQIASTLLTTTTRTTTETAIADKKQGNKRKKESAMDQSAAKKKKTKGNIAATTAPTPEHAISHPDHNESIERNNRVRSELFKGSEVQDSTRKVVGHVTSPSTIIITSATMTSNDELCFNDDIMVNDLEDHDLPLSNTNSSPAKTTRTTTKGNYDF
ncbi:hypothetical protein ACA910_009706 [Epithemia clementina (nom. ined.)]